MAILLEVTAYLALLPNIGRDEDAATHAFSSSYLRSGHSGDELSCTATVTHRSQIAFVFGRAMAQGRTHRDGNRYKVDPACTSLTSEPIEGEQPCWHLEASLLR
jgi:acyl-coenzyme A thioesterase PaaI-like protein